MADKAVMDMFADVAKQINLPKIDYEAFVEIHRKNIEAMQKSAAVVSEGGRAALAKQREILAEVGCEAQRLIADFRPGGSPQEVAAKQAELAKRVFEATVKNTRDVAELVRNRAKRPRSFSIECARALAKRERPSRPRRPDMRHPPRRGGGHEPALLQCGRIAARSISGTRPLISQRSGLQ
jgi:hypothetical protein